MTSIESFQKLHQVLICLADRSAKQPDCSMHGSASLEGWSSSHTLLTSDDVGDCAIASSFVSYLGPFVKEMREQLNNNLIGSCQKLAIPHSKDLHLTQFLTSDQEVGEWTVQVLVLRKNPLELTHGQ